MVKKSLREDLKKVLEADEEQIDHLKSNLLRKEAREIRRMAEVSS